MFSADSVTLDHNQNTLTAIGNVSIIFNNMKLSSDKIIYYKSLDEIHAKGKVSLVKKEGGFHNGENLIIVLVYGYKFILELIFILQHCLY